MSEDAMASPIMTNRDPALYRIRHAHHHRTGDKWCIYPMYDYTHPISDALENITHSLCTLEFQDHRPFYDWLVDTVADGGFVQRPVPRQYEFSRLNLTYVVMSKRKLRQLVDENIVSGWDDPRMPTIVGLRRAASAEADRRQFPGRRNGRVQRPGPPPPSGDGQPFLPVHERAVDRAGRLHGSPDQGLPPLHPADRRQAGRARAPEIRLRGRVHRI
jgi:hypothetical protein